jgi:hypothetical protein
MFLSSQEERLKQKLKRRSNFAYKRIAEHTQIPPAFFTISFSRSVYLHLAPFSPAIRTTPKTKYYRLSEINSSPITTD